MYKIKTQQSTYHTLMERMQNCIIKHPSETAGFWIALSVITLHEVF